MKAQDIYLMMLPILNQQWITPMFAKNDFVSFINIGIENCITYKWRLWSWQLTEKEVVNPKVWEVEVITLDYPIMGYYWTYIKQGGQRIDYEKAKRKKYAIFLEDEGVHFKIFDNVFKYKFIKPLEAVKFVYYRWIPPVKLLEDEIQMPEYFKPAIFYFAMSEAIPFYKTFEQGRDTVYWQKAVNYLENLKLHDWYVWNKLDGKNII